MNAAVAAGLLLATFVLLEVGSLRHVGLTTDESGHYNELVWDRTKAYRILIDSNLGWRQNHWYVQQYLRRHPDAVVDPDGPRAGTIVISADLLAAGSPWLRENFEPVGHIAHGHLIFRITPEALRRVTDPVPVDWADKDR